uniref:Uncharacterized protein n=1 Tax=Arundo donax TaxID=35708 RepID=A0A0A8YFR5_ARUDO
MSLRSQSTSSRHWRATRLCNLDFTPWT